MYTNFAPDWQQFQFSQAADQGMTTLLGENGGRWKGKR
jgi:hypothetical protein